MWRPVLHSHVAPELTHAAGRAQHSWRYCRDLPLHSAEPTPALPGHDCRAALVAVFLLHGATAACLHLLGPPLAAALSCWLFAFYWYPARPPVGCRKPPELWPPKHVRSGCRV